MYNVNEIRKEFPILSRKINNYDLCYLDNSASAQKPSLVLNELNNFYMFAEAAQRQRRPPFYSPKAVAIATLKNLDCPQDIQR